MEERIMNLTRVDHVGIAVENLDEALKFYEGVLGLKSTGKEVVEEQKVTVAFLPCGDSELELLESTTPDGPIARFIEKNGGRGGIQHVAVRVDNIEAAIKEVMDAGHRMLDEKPRYGAGGARIAFVHPKTTGGVLLELTERK
jgi:methylmalonyl-CoA/ethylmalonyl-CoA epimerase